MLVRARRKHHAKRAALLLAAPRRVRHRGVADAAHASARERGMIEAVEGTDLQLNEDEAFQRREWKVQRIA